MSGSIDQRWQLIGRAETTGATALDVGTDPIEAARAVRRAIAAAKRHAVDVDHLVVAAERESPHDALRAFARRALGPRGEQVTVSQLASTSRFATDLADAALASVENDPRQQQGLAIAVGLAPDGTTVVLCAAQGSRIG